jgi:hypothetical protein
MIMLVNFERGHQDSFTKRRLIIKIIINDNDEKCSTVKSTGEN